MQRIHGGIPSPVKGKFGTRISVLPREVSISPPTSAIQSENSGMWVTWTYNQHGARVTVDWMMRNNFPDLRFFNELTNVNGEIRPVLFGNKALVYRIHEYNGLLWNAWESINLSDTTRVETDPIYIYLTFCALSGHWIDPAYIRSHRDLKSTFAASCTSYHGEPSGEGF